MHLLSMDDSFDNREALYELIDEEMKKIERDKILLQQATEKLDREVDIVYERYKRNERLS